MSENASTYEMTRARFLTTGLAGGALLLGIDLGITRREARAGVTGAGQVNVYVRIGADETITIIAPNSEMGQGTSTALPQIVAEELKVDWSQVRMELAGASTSFANPMFRAQLTGGSTAVRGYHDSLRIMGASAREMLVAAAATRFGVSPAACVAESGRVRSGGQVATYGELAAAAALLAPPTNPPLTQRADFRLIGKSVKRLDIPAKVNGSAIFGIDVRLPGMLYASVKLAPKVGQTVASYSAPPSGMTVVPVPNGVAVVTSTTTWQAIKAARSLRVTWADAAHTAATDTATMKATAAQLMASGSPVRVAKNVGDAAAAVQGSAKVVDATYSVPYLPHATLEPMNATALVTQTSCEIWAPTQSQVGCVQTAARVTGLPTSAITVHTTFLGGGLGRKGELDFIEQAVIVAQANQGTPVKLVWSREEDFTHDYYRPAALCHLTGGVDAQGNVTGFVSRNVSPSIGYQKNPARYANPAQVDSSAVEGLNSMMYAIGNQRIEWVLDSSAQVQVSYWRSVGNSYNVFFAECFIDELAGAAGRDPVDFRRGLLASNPRALAVLNLLADKSGWATPVPPGRARGVAIAETFGSIVGEVAEISGSLSTGIKVQKVTVVIDCGTTINPDTVQAQMESAVVQGLGAALWSDMPFKAGQPMRRNFNTFRMPKLRDMPQIDTYIIESGAPLGGVGEPGLPPIAPAVVNAIAKLTGTRVRSLPIHPQAVPTS
jgi:isoquinoline 1-oxidoreductase beta subunit